MSKTEREPSLKASDTKLDPDIIYEEIGGFGKFQYFVYILLCVPLTLIVCCNFSYIFIASDMDYRYVVISTNCRKYIKLYCRCFIPECDVDDGNHTAVEWIARAIPTAVDGKLSKCERFMPMSINKTDDSTCPWNFNQSDAVTCQDFVYLPDEHFLLNEV